MVTVMLSEMINEAAAVGITFAFVADDALKVTAPKTPEATALLQRMAPHKAAIKAHLLAPEPAPTEAQPEIETFTDNDFAPIDYTDLPFGDLTNWLGHVVDADTMSELEAECYWRYAGAFVFTAKQVADGWKVTRFGVPTDDAPTVYKPPLPARRWVVGITTLAEARRIQSQLAQSWRTSLSKVDGRYHVRCPGWMAMFEDGELNPIEAEI